MNTLDLNGQIKNSKRCYKKSITDLMFVLHNEMKHIDNEGFEPEPGIDSAAFRLIQEINRLKSLLEVEQ